MFHDYDFSFSFSDAKSSIEDMGYIHVEDLPNMDIVRDHLKGIVEAIYETADMNALIRSLEEVCYQYDIDLPLCESKIITN